MSPVQVEQLLFECLLCTGCWTISCLLALHCDSSRLTSEPERWKPLWPPFGHVEEQCPGFLHSLWADEAHPSSSPGILGNASSPLAWEGQRTHLSGHPGAERCSQRGSGMLSEPLTP